MPQLLGDYARHCVAGQPHSDDCGQSLIELALVLPVFLLLTIGLMNVCIVLFGIGNLSFASRQASRYACLHSQTSVKPVDQTTIDAMIAPYVFKFPTNTYSNQISYSAGGNVIGGRVTVSINITYKVTLPYLTLPAIPLSFSASGTIVQ